MNCVVDCEKSWCNGECHKEFFLYTFECDICSVKFCNPTEFNQHKLESHKLGEIIIEAKIKKN